MYPVAFTCLKMSCNMALPIVHRMCAMLHLHVYHADSAFQQEAGFLGHYFKLLLHYFASIEITRATALTDSASEQNNWKFWPPPWKKSAMAMTFLSLGFIRLTIPSLLSHAFTLLRFATGLPAIGESCPLNFRHNWMAATCPHIRTVRTSFF